MVYRTQVVKVNISYIHNNTVTKCDYYMVKTPVESMSLHSGNEWRMPFAVRFVT